MTSTTIRPVLALCAVAVGLSACGSFDDGTAAGSQPSDQPATTAESSGDTGVSGSEGFPVTVENCGRELTFDAPPERVVGLWQPANEMLLALGAADQVDAFAGFYTDPPDTLAPAAEGIEQIGTSMAWPSREVLLQREPDLVVSELLEGFAFDTSQGYASVEQIEESGAQVYSTRACSLGDASGARLDTVFTDLRNLGRILGREERAEDLVAELEAQRADVVAAVEGLPQPRVAFYNGGEGPVYVLSGGIWDDAITTAGGVNVLPPDAIEVSLEEFSATNADVVLVGSYPGQDFETGRAFVETTFPDLPAVRDGRIVEIPTVETENGPRVMLGLARVAAALHPDAGIQIPEAPGAP